MAPATTYFRPWARKCSPPFLRFFSKKFGAEGEKTIFFCLSNGKKVYVPCVAVYYFPTPWFPKSILQMHLKLIKQGSLRWLGPPTPGPRVHCKNLFLNIGKKQKFLFSYIFFVIIYILIFFFQLTQHFSSARKTQKPAQPFFPLLKKKLSPPAIKILRLFFSFFRGGILCLVGFLYVNFPILFLCLKLKKGGKSGLRISGGGFFFQGPNLLFKPPF